MTETHPQNRVTAWYDSAAMIDVMTCWRLVAARHRDEIEQLEAVTGSTQRAAVDYVIEQSDWRICFPGFVGGKGTPAARLAAARRFARRAILYLVAGYRTWPGRP